MFKNRMVPMAAVVGLLLVPAACTKENRQASEMKPEEVTPTVSETERPGTDAPGDISPATARLRISDLKVGPQLGSDGAVVENVDEVLPGESVHASISVGEVAAGSAVKAVWIGPDDQRLGESVKDVAQGLTYLTFDAPDTTAWTPGDYKVESAMEMPNAVIAHVLTPGTLDAITSDADKAMRAQGWQRQANLVDSPMAQIQMWEKGERHATLTLANDKAQGGVQVGYQLASSKQ